MEEKTEKIKFIEEIDPYNKFNIDEFDPSTIDNF